MPIIKSSKKRAKQNLVANIRNHAQLSRMRSFVKNIIKWTHNGEVQKAEGIFDETQKCIDTCSKNNLIHKNNAARKKSRIAKLISSAKSQPKKATHESPKPAPKEVKKEEVSAPAEESAIEKEES